MTDVRKLHRTWPKDPACRKARRDLAPEFELARARIAARATSTRPVIRSVATKPA